MQDNVYVAQAAVNGGSDTVNPGITCIKLNDAVAGTCSGGWVGIPNNSRILVAAALLAKSSNAPVMAYYFDTASPALHCPGVVMTTCTLNSILVK